MMRILRASALAIAALASSLAMFAGSAAASRSLSLSPGGSFTATSMGLVSFSSTLAGSPLTVSCNGSLTGSFPRSIGLTRGTTLATITSISYAGCHPLIGAATSIAVIGVPPWVWQVVPPLLPSKLEGSWSSVPIYRKIVNGVCQSEFSIPVFNPLIEWLGGSGDSLEIARLPPVDTPMRATSSTCGLTAGTAKAASYRISPTSRIILIN